jgi:pyruvate dehydrogenase E2 component (dihydrolipoamide acetyltransferase)
MRYDFRLPDIGEGVAQGEVVKWFVKEGEQVQEEKPLVSVLTDKANVEIPSPVSGRVLQLHAREGEVVKVGSLLVSIETETPTPSPSPAGAPERTPASRPPTTSSAAPPPSPSSPAPSPRVLAAPSVRRKAQEWGIDLTQVPGTGPNGLVTEADLEAYRKGGGPPRASAPSSGPPSSFPISSPPQGSAAEKGPPPREERIPIRGLRRVISEHMANAVRHAAHFTYVEEVEVDELVRLRERFRKRFEEKGIALTYLPFIVKAVVQALQRHPKLNARVDDEKQEIVICHHYHIGIAAAAPDGLIVPVLRDADRKSIAQIAREIQDLAERGKAGKLSREELSGSTFSITSLGALGGLLATPILNYPEVGILGVHKIQKRPAYLPDGTLGPRHFMNLSISLDHRVVDGIDGAEFLASVKTFLEDPHQLFLELV